MTLKFWWEACETAVYLINRLPSPGFNNETPYYKLLYHEQDYSFLKIFGCTCYPHLRPYSNHKLQFRSSKCIFLGNSMIHKGYKCLHGSGRVYIARNVIFNEEEFPLDSDSMFNKQRTPKVSTHLTTTCNFSLCPVCLQIITHQLKEIKLWVSIRINLRVQQQVTVPITQQMK